MTANREVKVAIDVAHTQSVCDYTVGLLRFKRGDKAEIAVPAGTGIFAMLGRVFGILTAGHVVKPMKESEVVGLVRFPTVVPALQNRRLDLNLTQRIVIWNEKECDAPDIAFLKIAELTGRDLQAAGAVFYNLGLQRNCGALLCSHAQTPLVSPVLRTSMACRW